MNLSLSLSLSLYGQTRARASSFTRFPDHTHDAPQPVGLLWTSDQPDADTSTRQHTTLTTNVHAPGAIRIHNPSRRAAVDLSLRPRGHWDRQHERLLTQNNLLCKHTSIIDNNK